MTLDDTPHNIMVWIIEEIEHYYNDNAPSCDLKKFEDKIDKYIKIKQIEVIKEIGGMALDCDADDVADYCQKMLDNILKESDK